MVLLVASTAVAHRAAADPIRLRPDFTPQPLVTPEVKVRVESNTYVADRWRKCGEGGATYTTKDPALTFDLDAAMDLRIRLDSRDGKYASFGGAVVVFPDHSYLCESDRGELIVDSWPAGHYELYLIGNSIEAAATLRFEQPKRAAALAAAAVKAMPHVALGAPDVLNPRYQPVVAPLSFDAADVGPICAKLRERVVPLAWLDVTRASSWFVASGDQDLFVLAEDGKCFNPGGDGAALPVGHHQLWAKLAPGQAAPTNFELELDDRSARPTYPPAETREVGALDQLLVIPGTVRPAERWSSRRDACRGAGRAPDFYLHSDRPLQHVTMSLLWSHAPERLHVAGPLDHPDDDRLRCGDGDDAHAFDLLEGTYGVWIGGADGAAGSPYHVLVSRQGLTIDPLTALAPIPDELTIPDRAIKHHYPAFEGRKLGDWTALFTLAPDRLFVYPRAAISHDDVAVPEGEPLLVSSADDREVDAIRYDGSYVRLDARLITATRPATVTLPKTIKVPEATSVSSAQDLAGPEDAKALAAFHSLDNKVTGCIGDYLAAHDPTWGHSDQVYRVGGDGSVVNVSDQVGRAAEAHCGGARVEAAERNLLASMTRTRTARWKAHLAAVRARFGL